MEKGLCWSNNVIRRVLTIQQIQICHFTSWMRLVEVGQVKIDLPNCNADMKSRIRLAILLQTVSVNRLNINIALFNLYLR